MKGLKLILFGFMFILIGGFIMVDTSISLGGVGELVLFAIGIVFGVKGLGNSEN